MKSRLLMKTIQTCLLLLSSSKKSMPTTRESVWERRWENVTCKVNLSLNLSSNIALCLGFFFLILCMKDRSGDREEKSKMGRENAMWNIYESNINNVISFILKISFDKDE